MVDIDALKQELKFWRAQAIYTPQPLILDVYVDLSQLDYSSKQLYLNSKRINVDSLKSIDASGNMIQKTCILLETWQLHAT